MTTHVVDSDASDHMNRRATRHGRPAVEENMPPAALLRVLNPVMKILLRSPLHRTVSSKLILLSVTGRRTGRTYTTPVGRHEFEGLLLVSASGGWRHNLRGGAPVRVTIDGRTREGYAELDEDPQNVAATFGALLERVGLDRARDLGLKVNVQRPPTIEEIQAALRRRAIARIRLSESSEQLPRPAARWSKGQEAR